MDLTVRTIRVQNQLIIAYSNCSALLFLNIPKGMPIWVL